MADGVGVDVSIVIPVLDDAPALASLLNALDAASGGVEVIVVDGGSRDHSCELAGAHRCKIVQTGPGRARQMNAGAGLAEGRWLWFLHADSDLLYPLECYLASLTAASAWGFFPVRLSGRGAALRVVESAMNFRSRLTGMATGDQGLFVRRSLYDAIGGFPPIPLMEDIALSRRLRCKHDPLVARLHLGTSSRRWERDGVCRTVWLMWRLRFAYWRGVSPQLLWRKYYGER